MHSSFRCLTAQKSASLTLGFLGLGQMGRHMAANLLKHAQPSERLLVYDIQPTACTQFVQTNSVTAKTKGVQVAVATSPREIAEQADVVVSMLPSSPHCLQLYLDEQNGMRRYLKKGSVIMDSSTIDPATSQLIASTLMADGRVQTVVDAPVSGGILGAEAGTLTFMVGGSPQDYQRAEPTLKKMGKNIVHCGPTGMGQVAKICNNMLLGISMLATAETLNLGIRLGMDPKVLSQIIATSSGRNWSLDTYNPVPGVLPNVPASRNYAGGFNIGLMAKDMGLATQAAQQSGSPCILGSLSKELYNVVSSSSSTSPDGQLETLNTKDFSVVFKWLQEHGLPTKRTT